MSEGDARIGLIKESRRNYYGGALMVVLGVGAAVKSLHYQVGTLTAMGTGFFPLILGAALAVIGILMIASSAWGALAHNAPEANGPLPKAKPEWRGWGCILGGIVAFVVLGRWGGLLPATFAITFISALGDRENSWLEVAGLATAITLISVVVFWWALGIQLPLLTWG